VCIKEKNPLGFNNNNKRAATCAKVLCFHYSGGKSQKKKETILCVHVCVCTILAVIDFFYFFHIDGLHNIQFYDNPTPHLNAKQLKGSHTHLFGAS
jgi:hypothetical protein